MKDQIETARVCHEANRAYCETLGDHSQPRWEDAPEWQRSSAIKGVEFCGASDGRRELREVTVLVGQKPQKAAYGPVKDANLKTHPCFMPYDGLPLDQRMKDYIFAAIVEAFFTASQV